jgi:hypothetical protein
VGYTFAQLQALWVQAGGDAAIAPLMAAVALAESAGNPNASNLNNDGSVDQGLWQINSSHAGEPGIGTDLTSPIANARSAVAVFAQQGICAWATVGPSLGCNGSGHSDAYLNFLGGAGSANAAAVPAAGSSAGSGPALPPISGTLGATITRYSVYGIALLVLLAVLGGFDQHEVNVVIGGNDQ